MDIFTRELGVYVFGRFQLDPVRRTLRLDGEPVKLGARLLDTLLYLVQNHDRLVQRDELQQAVWRGRAVDENSLGQAISGLRKALQAGGTSENFIVTVAGRGYRFGVPVEFLPAAAPGPSAAPSRAAGGDLAPPNRQRLSIPAAILGAGLCLTIVAMAAWFFWPRRDFPLPQAHFEPPPHSVAVMAFANMSGDAAQEYFADGLSDELINALSRLPQLLVVARTSSFSFKGKPTTIDEVAHKLNVGAVLEGSVRRSDRMLHITAQLIDGRTGFQLWSASYDPAPGDLLKVQGDIAASVTRSLQVKLLGQDTERLTLGGTANPQAFDAYLRGMQLASTADEAGYRRAIAAFDEAISLDPGYALARARRAGTLQGLVDAASITDVVTLQAMENDALAEAKRAVAMAPDLPSGHAVLANILADARLDFTGAQAEIQRARELAPRDFDANLQYAELAIDLGPLREAVAAAKLAASLDPLRPATLYNLAVVLAWARQFAEAEAALRRAELLSPRFALQDRDLQGEIELLEGKATAAHKTCAGATNWQDIWCLAMADHAVGNAAAADADMARLRALLADTGAFQYAEIYAQWGRRDEALHWLERAYGLHDPGLRHLKADLLLDPIRDMPGFKDIEQRLRFPT